MSAVAAETRTATPLLYKHEDGRYLVVAACGSKAVADDPGWHRLGPVEIESQGSSPPESSFKIGVSDEGDPVVWAANDESLRSGMALVAMQRATGLLLMARNAGIARLLAEDHRHFGDGGLDDAFNRAIRVLQYGLFISRNSDVNDCTDEIFGREWLIGKRDEHGNVVADL